MNSKLIATLLLGIASFALIGCDDDKPKETAVKIYKSIDECRVDHSEEDCQKGFSGAREAHETSAPHIPTREECVAKYGIDACIERHDANTGNSWFVPAMTGFMIGHMMGSLNTPTYQPIYVDRSGYAYSGNAGLGNWRSSCGPSDYSCRHSGGYVSVAPSSTSSTWTRNYNTTTIVTTPGAAGKPSIAAPAPSSRGGFGLSSSTGGTSIGKSSPMGNTSIASPGASSARGGFGGAASSFSSAGG